MVKLLLLKMLRDIRRSLSTYLVCILILAIGFTGYSVLSIATIQLASSRDYFFEITAFSEVFAEIQEAPVAIARRLEQIEGVEQATGRIVKTVPLAGGGENAPELKLYSYSENSLNRPLLTRGALPAEGEDALLLGDGFYEAHGLSIGDTVPLQVSGRVSRLAVAGSGISPESIYMVKSIIDMLPDSAQYDAAFVRTEVMEQLFGMEGTVNDFVLTLTPGTLLNDVEEEIRQVLRPYGCYRVYDRDSQLSTSILKMEIDNIEKVASVIPFLFLGIAAVILYITLSRLIERHRTQIGTLMALGLTGRTISLHYMLYAATVGLIGGLLGGIYGTAAAGPMADFYRVFFRLPDVGITLSPKHLIISVLLSTVFCAAVGYFSVRSSTQLAPAEALRPAPPPSVKTSFFERLPGLMALFTVPGTMAVRSLVRNKRRSALSLFGIACAYMITASLVSMYSLMDVFIFDHLQETQRQDITVAFEQPVARQDAARLLRDPDIQELQGVLDLSATIRGAGGKADCTIQGVPADTSLTRLYDLGGNPLTIPNHGIVLSDNIAKVLGVGPGSTVEIEVTYPISRITRVPVTAVSAQYLGSVAYMSPQGAARVSGYGDSVTSVLIKAPEEVRERLLTRLADADHVGGVQSRAQRLEQFQGMMGMINGMMGGMAMIGVVVGVAVVYVSSVISYEELKREISTMLMLGLNTRQCLEVISTGQWILTVLGILLGIPMTYGVSRLISASMTNEMFTIPGYVEPQMLLLGALLICVSVLISSKVIHRQLKKVSPADMLRERE